MAKIVKGAQELKDLDVDRIDGVDRPATGRSFLLIKDEDGADAVLKGYGATATAANILLEKMRVDKNAVVSRSTAVALNGLAQVLGAEPVFVGKSVPTQPYEITEPDVNRRGPADEGIGQNFTPRSMPGSMVGSVSFRVKDDSAVDGVAEPDADDAKRKGTAKRLASAASKAAYEQADGEAEGVRNSRAEVAYRATFKAVYGEEDEERVQRSKAAAAKARAKQKDDEGDDDNPDMGSTERANRGVARSAGPTAIERAVEAQGVQIADLTKSVTSLVKIAKGEIEGVVKARGDVDEDQPERVERGRARSRQIEEDQPVQVRKGAGSDSRFGTSFANVVFSSGGK